MGRGYPPHAGRQISLRLRAHHQHAFGIQGRSQNGNADIDRFLCHRKQPRGFSIDPTGRYLLAAGQLSNSMTAYAIDKATGKLTKLKDYPVGKNRTGSRSWPSRASIGALRIRFSAPVQPDALFASVADASATTAPITRAPPRRTRKPGSSANASHIHTVSMAFPASRSGPPGRTATGGSRGKTA